MGLMFSTLQDVYVMNMSIAWVICLETHECSYIMAISVNTFFRKFHIPDLVFFMETVSHRKITSASFILLFFHFL